MNLPFDFNYYLKKGIVKKVSPDISRASFLLEESKKSFEGLKKRINKMGIDEFSSNSIVKDIHDTIIQSIHSKMLTRGFSASGNYSHEAEVTYMKELGFSESEIFFMNKLRISRNGINYYGKIFEKEYANECYDFLLSISKKLIYNLIQKNKTNPVTITII